MKFIKQPVLVFVCAIALLLAFTPLSFFAVLTLIVLGAIYTPFPSSVDSLFLRVVLSFLLISCFYQVVAMALWLLNIQFTVPVAVSLGIVLVLVIAFMFPANSRIKFFTKSDLVALVVAALSISVLFAGIVRGGNITQQLLRYVTSGFDNSIHLSLMQTTYNNQGYVYGDFDEVSDKIIYKDLNGYPQGWHLINTLIWQSIDTSLSTDKLGQLLAFYVATIWIWYALVIYLMVKLVILIGEYITSYSSTTLGNISASMLVFLSQTVLLFGLLRYGFANFIGLLALLFGLCLLASCLLLTEGDNENEFSFFVISGALLTAGMAFTWLLAAPVGAMAVFLAVVHHKPNFNSIKKWLLNSWLRFSILLLLLGLSVAQAAVQLLYGQKGQIQEDGGIMTPNYLLIFGVLITVLGFLTTKKNNLRSLFMVLVSGPMILAGIVYVYQLFTVGEPLYYSAKLGILALCVLLVFAASMVQYIFSKLFNQSNFLTSLTFIIAFSVFMPLAVGAKTDALRFLSSKNWMLSTTSADQVLKLYPVAERGKNIIVYKELDYEEDLVASHFFTVTSRVNVECRKNAVWGLLSGQDDLVNEGILRCAQEDPSTFYVISSSKNYTALKSFFANQSNIEVVLSN